MSLHARKIFDLNFTDSGLFLVTWGASCLGMRFVHLFLSKRNRGFFCFAECA